MIFYDKGTDDARAVHEAHHAAVIFGESSSTSWMADYASPIPRNDRTNSRDKNTRTASCLSCDGLKNSTTSDRISNFDNSSIIMSDSELERVRPRTHRRSPDRRRP